MVAGHASSIHLYFSLPIYSSHVEDSAMLKSLLLWMRKKYQKSSTPFRTKKNFVFILYQTNI
jgi:hypothetical protein